MVIMKKTQVYELMKNIKGTFIPFISIVMFVLFAVGVFTGISWGATSLRSGIDGLAEGGRMHDIRYVFPYGFSESDLERLLEVEGVDEIQGAHYSYNYLVQNGNRVQAKVVEITDTVDVPMLVEGDLPSKNGEIAVETNWANENGIGIGDIIVFEKDGDKGARIIPKLLEFDVDKDEISSLDGVDNPKSGMTYLKTDTFTVTAFMETVDVLMTDPSTYGISEANKLPVNCYMYVSGESFDMEAFSGYPQVMIRSNMLRGLSVSDQEYIDRVRLLEEQITPVANEIANEKNEAIHSKIQAILDKQDGKISDYEKELNDAEGRINDAKVELSDAREQVEKARDEIAAKERELSNAKSELDRAEAQIKELEDAIGMQENAGVTGPELEGQKAALLAAKSDFENNRKTYEDGLAMLNDKRAELSDGESRLADSQAKLSESETELNDSRNDLDGGKSDYDDFKDKTGDIEDCNTVSMIRPSNVGIAVAMRIADIMDGVRTAMSSLFVIVGLLVCYSAITRIINDQIIQIGTKKSLGMRRGEIVLSYLGYTGLATVLGCIGGLLLGAFFVEPIINMPVSQEFIGEAFDRDAILFPGVLICIIEIFLILLITWFSTRGIIRKNAIQLLAGPQQSVGKERFFEKSKLWNRMSLMTQTVINNTLNEKRRVIGTLVGVAGCTSLLVTAFTLNDNILNSFGYQYDNYYFYDSSVYFDEDNESGEDAVKAILDEKNLTGAVVRKDGLEFQMQDGRGINAFVTVFDDVAEFEKMVRVVSFEGGEDKVSVDGMWISAALANHYGLKSGEDIILRDSEGNFVAAKVGGYFNCHAITCQVFMTKECYEEIYGKEFRPNAFYVNTEGIDKGELILALNEAEGFLMYEDSKALARSLFLTFQKIANIMVLVYSLLSIAMAIVVLLNLFTMSVKEKKQEVIVMLINGYSVKAAKKYISADTILLTIIGIIVGIALGDVVGGLSVEAFDSAQSMFLKMVDWKAGGIGAAGTVVLTFIMNRISVNHIKRFKLTDLKS